MNTDHWNYLYKFSEMGLCTTNMLYTPKINPEKNMMCMIWDETESYQQHNHNLTTELIQFFFEREIRYFNLFQNYSWCPTIIDIDMSSKKIFLEWNDNTLNKILFNENNLDEQCSNWKVQLFDILKDIKEKGYYKLSLYPHCFYLGKDSKIKTFDFYPCIEITNPYISRSSISGMIGPLSAARFDRAEVGDLINFEIFLKDTLLNHLHTYWPDNPFPMYYERLFKNACNDT